AAYAVLRDGYVGEIITPQELVAAILQAALDEGGVTLVEWDGEARAVSICDLCGQPLYGNRCNSGIHQGPDDPMGFKGRAVLSTEFVAKARSVLEAGQVL